nr:Chain 1, BIV-2 cyclic peptide [synthetic construct]
RVRTRGKRRIRVPP